MTAILGETLAEIRARHAARTPGPYVWHGWGGRERKRVDLSLCTTHSGMIIVMDFVRSGMSGAQPRFRTEPEKASWQHSGILKPAREFVHYPRDYKDEIMHVDNADAIAIERSWEDVDALLRERDALAAAVCSLMHCSRMDEFELGHHASECPLNTGYVPTWKRESVTA